MNKIVTALHEFFSSARTYIFLSTLLAGSVALHLLNQQQADAILKAAVELGIAFFGSTWTQSVGNRDIGTPRK
jgi:GH24 family phage-related lysozyme (muramidase)